MASSTSTVSPYTSGTKYSVSIFTVAKPNPFFVKESLIADSAVGREEFFHANMAVMQDARIVNEPDRIAVSKTDGNAG